MKLTNKSNLSLSVAVWLAEDNYDHNSDPNHISATGLLKPIKQIVLSSRMPPQDIEFDIMEQIPSSMGTSLHEGIERAWMNDGYKRSLYKMGYPEELINRIVLNPKFNPTIDNYPLNAIYVYMEQRTEKQVGNHTVSGKFDFVGDGTLEDFKSTGTYSYMAGSNDEKYSLQGSIYKWLNPDIITSDYMLIQYIFTDWSKMRANIEAKKGYPATRMLAHKVPLKSIEWTDAWIKDKLSQIDLYMDMDQDSIPDCTPEELWQGKSVFKYYKNPHNTKRATKNFDQYHEAEARRLADGSVGLVVEVPGQVKACLYCQAFDICKQKNVHILDGTLVI